MSVEISTAKNRVRLRLVLLASSAFMLLLALFAYALVGIQWAIAPLVLALLTFGIGAGRLSGRSLALLNDDLRVILTGSWASVPPANSAEEEVPSAT